MPPYILVSCQCAQKSEFCASSPSSGKTRIVSNGKIMSTVSVVRYQSAGSPTKLAVLQTNSQNIRASRKPPPLTEKPPLQPKDILLTNPGRKKGGSRVGGATAKLTNPAPVAVARRNARERNRVKQVNNGFATLRQHIPTAVAAAFESCNGRGGSKKLSKVETLRMAVEYIRLLEEMLTGSASPPPPPPQPPLPSLPPATTLAPYQFAFYDDDENLRPHEDELDEHEHDDDDILAADIELNKEMLLSSMQTTGSLSPEFYSDDSLGTTFGPAGDEIKLQLTPDMLMSIKSEPLEEDAAKENAMQTLQWWESHVVSQRRS